MTLSLPALKTLEDPHRACRCVNSMGRERGSGPISCALERGRIFDGTSVYAAFLAFQTLP